MMLHTTGDFGSTLQRLLMAAGCSLGVAASAFGQPVAYSFKYTQNWTRPLCSHISVVRNCPSGPPAAFEVAYDDWICTLSGPIVRVEWWGAQPFATKPPPKAFYISIYADNNCTPGVRLYQTCVLASSILQGTDCCGKRVFRFGANISGFSQTAGVRYWLQISESDLGINMQNVSPTTESPDFEWSVHRPIVGCPALEAIPAVPGFYPLWGPCGDGPETPDDLAFRLASRVIIVHTGSSATAGTLTNPCGPGTGPGDPPPDDYSIYLRRPSDGMVIEALHATADSNGDIVLDPEAPGGTYLLEIRGAGAKSTYVCGVNLADGVITNLGSVQLVRGDANGDNQINFFDITYVLANFNR